MSPSDPRERQGTDDSLAELAGLRDWRDRVMASWDGSKKPPCFYLLPDGRRCCECDACHMYQPPTQTGEPLASPNPNPAGEGQPEGEWPKTMTLCPRCGGPARLEAGLDKRWLCMDENVALHAEEVRRVRVAPVRSESEGEWTIYMCPECGYWHGEREGLWAKPQRCSACIGRIRGDSTLMTTSMVSKAPMTVPVRVAPVRSLGAEGDVERIIEVLVGKGVTFSSRAPIGAQQRGRFIRKVAEQVVAVLRGAEGEKE